MSIGITNHNGVPIKLAPPESELEIMRAWGGSRQPVVSICCATYNHVKFIEDSIHSFLAQDTSFPFEIVIRDDGSTDGTSEIVREYSRRYPSIVRGVIETENQFSKGIRPLHIWPSLARGEFIALCEGDDFWIDSFKLQKQVDLLKKHPEAVMSVAKTQFCRQEGEQLSCVCTHEGWSDKVLLGFEEVKQQYFHTSSYVIRSNILGDVISNYFSGHCLFGDTALRSILISYGPFALLPEVVSVYRQTGSGIWTSLSLEQQLKWEIEATRKLARMLTGKHKKLQQEKLFGFYRSKLICAFKAGQFTAGLALLPHVLSYGVLKAPHYASRRLGQLGQYFQ